MSKLYLAVGSLFTQTPEEDPEEFEDEQARISEMQAWLADQGVKVDLLSEPGRQMWHGEVAEFAHIYHLRVIAAHLGERRDIAKFLEPRLARTAEPDPVLAAVWNGSAPTPYDHLINHTLTDGFYLPVDFASPIWAGDGDEEEDDEEEPDESVVSFGSSVALARELTELKRALAKHKLPVNHPAYVALLTLDEAARHSVAHKMPVSIWE